MKIRLYTEDEINSLEKSIFIKRVKYKRELEYEPLFKLWTIMMKHDCPELSAREIFSCAGLDVSILHKKLPQRRIREWCDFYDKYGINYFIPEGKYYESLPSKNVKNISNDSFKNQLMNFVLNRLKEINNE